MKYALYLRWAVTGAAAGTLAAWLSGCAQLSQGVAAVGQAAGVVNAQQAESIVKVGTAAGKAWEDITPEQEYFVGRAVGATIITKFGALNNQTANEYLNLIGQTLAAASDRPETFKGYHFLLMNSDEINAFAAPGGFIFISKGMLKLCRSEDELAAVLAHEVAHVQLKHAINAIDKSRLTQALWTTLAEAGKNLGGEKLAQLTTAFEGSIGDITKTLVTSGYARSQEREADRVAVQILQRVGYNPAGLVSVLQNMSAKLKPDGHDFAATHPPPAERIKDLQKLLTGSAAAAVSPARQQRFSSAIGGV